MGSGLNNSLKYSMLMDSRNGWYYGQRIAIALTIAITLYISKSTTSGSKGLELVSTLFYSSLILTTFACVSIFSSAVTDDKENGVLPLIMMTGMRPFSYTSSKFLSKFFQLSSLLLIMIPPTLFAITLGGVAVSQVVNLFTYIIIWLLLVSSLSFWPSVLFKTKQEASIISTIIISILLILLTFFECSPFLRASQIIQLSSEDLYSFREIYIFLAISFFSLYSSNKNLHYGILFPISFMDNYFERMKIKRFKGQIENYNGENIIIRTPKRLSIMAKDKYLVPYKPMFSENIVLNISIGSFLILTFPFGFTIGVIWLVATPLILTWKRITQVIALELDNQTFSGLMALPMSNKQLLEEKINSACLYPSKIPYIILLSALSLTGIIQANLNLILIAIFLPFIYESLIYLTSWITFKSREMVKVTSFSACLLLTMIYFSIPFCSPLSYLMFKYLKNLNIKELDRIGEISD